jgi:hypothetical protein
MILTKTFVNAMTVVVAQQIGTISMTIDFDNIDFDKVLEEEKAPLKALITNIDNWVAGLTADPKGWKTFRTSQLSDFALYWPMRKYEAEGWTVRIRPVSTRMQRLYALIGRTEVYDFMLSYH